MNLRVERKIFTDKSCTGHLFINGVFQCFTLEPPWKEDDTKPRAIPQGTYTLTNRFSAKHNATVPHVEDVPGFEEIEIHPGNFPKDTLGCLLVGTLVTPAEPDTISHSKIAFTALMEKLLPIWDAKEPIDITYTNFKF